MLARFQQCITLGLVAAALVWLAVFWPAHPAWAVSGALTFLLGYALILAAEFLLLPFVNARDPVPRAGARLLLRAWWSEVRMAPRVFFWRQPFRADAEPDYLPVGDVDDAGGGRGGRGGRGVVLVHGLFCNRGFWAPWLRALRQRGQACVAVNLEPVWGSIDAYADTLSLAVQHVTDATGQPPVLVCHSMGGLAVRGWLRRTPLRVHRVITIATPHAGTWMARFGHGTNARQMRLGSEWLARLQADEAAAEPGAPCVPFVCWYSNADNIVCPPSTATLAGADNRLVTGTAHVALAFHPRVLRETLDLVGE